MTETSYQQRKRERDEIIVKLLKQGVNAKNVARQMRVDPKVVHNVRRAAGLPSAQRRVWDDEKIERARQLLAEGAPPTEVDRTLGIPRGSTRTKFPDQAWSHEQYVQLSNETNQRMRPVPEKRSPLNTRMMPPKAGTPFA